MSRLHVTLPALKSPLASGRFVTLDSLTAAAHPDAVVSGVLLATIGILVTVGLTGLIGPVVSLDLFGPDLSFGELVRSLIQIVVSAATLITAGLGLARHPRFPAAFMAVAASLMVLISFVLSERLLTGTLSAGLPLFTILSIPVILAVPYVVFSRRCRLIFYRRLNINDLKTLTSQETWPQPASNPMAAGPMLPAAHDGKAAGTPRRTRAPRAAPAATETSGRRAPAPPPPAPNDALRTALFGASLNPNNNPADESADAGGTTQGGAGKRVGLEALINLRPPGT